MKEAKRKIELGRVYSVKVAGMYMAVRIQRSLGHGRYEGTALPDGKTIKVATSAIVGTDEPLEQRKARPRPRQREVAAPAPTSPASAVTPAATTATAASAPAKPKRGKRATASVAAAPVPASVATAPATTATVKTAKAADVKPRKTSLLDAAAILLKAAGEPMNCADLTSAAIENDLWSSKGRTPANTLHAAITTDIAKKGEASRFRKTGRGLFDLTEVGKAGE